MVETTFTVVHDENSNISVLPAATHPCSSSSFIMAVRRSVTLTRYTHLPSGIIGKPVPKEERKNYICSLSNCPPSSAGGESVSSTPRPSGVSSTPVSQEEGARLSSTTDDPTVNGGPMSSNACV